MRIVYVSDLHSNIKLYYELEQLVRSVNADILIIGGDLFNHSRNIEPQLEFAKGYLYGFFRKINRPTYIIPGNTDRQMAVKYLDEMKKEGLLDILGLSGTVINNDIRLIGYEHIPPSPFKIKDYERRDMSKDSINFDIPCLLSDEAGALKLMKSDFLNDLPSIEEELNALREKKSIWVMHSPPYGGILDKTNADICAGSKAIRMHIERVQPLLTLHGHIHEAPDISNQWVERIGDTISINPGRRNSLHAAICDIDTNGEILSIEHNIYGNLRIKGGI